MDFSKLSSNDKLAAIGAILAIVGALLTFGGGGSFGLLSGIAMLVIIFLPQFSPATKLPGTKGSLMLIVGGVAGLGALLALLALLPVLGAIGFYGGTWLIGLLLGIAGGLLMGWASWQTFQGEGGKFNMGMPSTPSAPPAPPASTYTPPPAPMAPPTQEPMGDQGHEDHPQG
ncbi:MAG: hypothetical protein ACXWWU_00845 [Candidatus Limnocylindria bacterium]